MNEPRYSERQQRDEFVVSPANPTIKLARALQRRRIRQRERAMLVEGIRSISTAVAQGTRIQALLIDAERREQLAVKDVDRLRAEATRVLFVDSPLFKTLADTEHPQAVIAICDMPVAEIPANSSFVLVLDAVRDPGNLGTLIRAAAGAGVDGIALLPSSVDRYNSKAIRASAGAVFSIPVAQFPDIEHLVQHCFESRPQVVLADGDGETSYNDVDWTAPTILVVGGEADGVSETTRTYADIVARIPLNPAVESLNAALAGGIMLFEARRQRTALH